MQGTTVLGECRGIQDNQVILAVSLFQKLEGILAESLMTVVAGEVQLHVAVGQFDGLGTAVDGMDERRPTPHGIEREATCIAEHIQYPTVLGVFLQQGTVLALVDEETRLLSVQPVDVEH